jgi:hypothetical protein
VKLGDDLRKADENHSLSHHIKSNQSTLAAKRTVKIHFFNYDDAGIDVQPNAPCNPNFDIGAEQCADSGLGFRV